MLNFKCRKSGITRNDSEKLDGYDKTIQEGVSNIIEQIANQENRKSEPIELNDFYLPIKIQNDNEYEVKLHRKLDQ